MYLFKRANIVDFVSPKVVLAIVFFDSGNRLLSKISRLTFKSDDYLVELFNDLGGASGNGGPGAASGERF